MSDQKRIPPIHSAGCPTCNGAGIIAMGEAARIAELTAKLAQSEQREKDRAAQLLRQTEIDRQAIEEWKRALTEAKTKLAALETDNANMRQAIQYAETIMSDAADVIGTRFTTDDNGVVLPTKPTASTLLALVLALNNGIRKCNAAILGRKD